LNAPTAECFWAEPKRLLAGKYPGAFGDEAVARMRVEAILGAGVTLFLDLTEDGELDSYAHLLNEPGSVAAAPVARHVRRPIEDMWVTTDADLAATLDVIDDELARGGVVYVHCWGGCGRTGTVVSAWWVRHGADPGEALQRYHERSRVLTSLRCPEIPEQVAMVLAWERGR
jgi:protein-tyrosine phosphatase